MKKICFVGALAVALAGCWTVSETAYPEVTVASVPQGRRIAVRLSDFRTGVNVYAPVEGHASMNPEEAEETRQPTNAVHALQRTATGCIVSRVVAELKRKGYAIDHMNPDYTIEVKFRGPEFYEYDLLRQLGYMVCTLLTAEKNEVTWSATLTVYDKAGKKSLFTKEYVQNYQVTIWGPIPIASPACNVKGTERAASSWALTALSDAALADATAFIADSRK